MTLTEKELEQRTKLRNQLFNVGQENCDCIIVYQNLDGDAQTARYMLMANLKESGVISENIQCIADDKKLPGKIAYALNTMNINGALPDKKHYLFFIGVNVDFKVIAEALKLSYDVKTFTEIFVIHRLDVGATPYTIQTMENTIKRLKLNHVHMYVGPFNQSLSAAMYDLFAGNEPPEMVKVIDAAVRMQKNSQALLGMKVLSAIVTNEVDTRILESLAFNTTLSDISQNSNKFYELLKEIL
jgi:hypothetical protein